MMDIGRSSHTSFVTTYEPAALHISPIKFSTFKWLYLQDLMVMKPGDCRSFCEKLDHHARKDSSN